MAVQCEPLQELVGGGANAKYVRDCTELFLGGRGFATLCGFDRLLNLEVLWVNDNQLQAITNLDNNIRMKELYAHNNKICTLKGSLKHFKFLQQLDLSNNQLRDLEKLTRTLEKLRFLTHLNLKGNPCCEEPDYRLLVIHAMPGLKVLDQHAITDLERRKAKALIAGDIAILTVAFGKRVPAYDPQMHEKVSETSELEQDLARMAAEIRQKHRLLEEQKEHELYANNPSASYYARHTSLPPPPGLVKAQAAWAAATGRHSGHQDCTSQSLASRLAHIGAASTGLSSSSSSLHRSSTAPTLTDGSSYSPRDTLVLYSCRARGTLKPGSHITPLDYTATQVNYSVPAHFKTFRHHMAAASSWEFSKGAFQL
eukprot:jgi/Chrzof1/8538/Cz03g14240.t1